MPSFARALTQQGWLRRQLSAPLNRLVLTFSFALTMAFGLIGWLSLAAYDQMLDGDTRQTVLADHRGLMDTAQSEGRTGLINRINARVNDDLNREAVYVLMDEHKHLLAGHLSEVPPESLHASGWISFPWSEDGDEVIAYVQALPDGTVLVTGHTTGELRRQRLLITKLGLAMLTLLGLLSLFLGWLLKDSIQRALQRSLDTVDQFVAGKLAARIPEAEGTDSLSRLGHTLNRMLDRIQDLVGGIQSSTDALAHDLRTPLTRLITRLEQAHQRCDQPTDPSSALPPVRRAIEEALEDADQLMLTFNGLLRLARIEGNDQLPPEKVPLNEVIQDAVELWQAVAESMGSSLLWQDPAQRLASPSLSKQEPSSPADEQLSEVRNNDLWTIQGDRDLLFQLLSNVLDNAIKYGGGNGAIELKLHHDGSFLNFSIRDHGPGIPEEQLERVMDRFVRLESHRGSPGTGLGLSLVKAIAQRHHAELRLSNAQPGLMITVRFPFVH